MGKSNIWFLPKNTNSSLLDLSSNNSKVCPCPIPGYSFDRPEIDHTAGTYRYYHNQFRKASTTAVEPWHLKVKDRN